jgi:hypothetical protein
MASSSQVHTVHDNPRSNGSQQAQEGSQAANGQAGKSLDDKPLPEPQAPPPEVSMPPRQDEFEKNNPSPSDDDKKAWRKEWETYQTWKDYLKDKDVVENMRQETGKESIFDGQNFLNKDEAAEVWMDELYLLARTQAEPEKKRHSYLCE